MTAAAEEKRSILSSTVDLLHYHRWGNFGVFDRCFRKSCDLLGVTFPDEAILRKLRTFGFAFLRNTGFLDVYYSGTVTQWSASAPCLAQVGERSFAIIGNSDFRSKVANLLPAGTIEEAWPHGYFDGLPGDTCLYPHIPLIKMSLSRAKAIVGASGILISESIQDRLFGALPSGELVVEQCVAVAEHAPTFEPGTLETYDFAAQTWGRYDQMLISDEGIFRRVFTYQAPDYFVGFRRNERLVVGQVQEREWLLVCGFALLSKKVPAKYRRSAGLFSVQLPQGFSLPVLLERCLRSGDLRGPETQYGWRQYSNISERSLWKLRTALPIFSVEVS